MKFIHSFFAVSIVLGVALAPDAQAANKNDIKSAITQQTSKVDPRNKNKFDGIV